jgi:hypothetical protein
MSISVTVEGSMSVAWIDIWGWRGVCLANDRIGLVIAPDIGGRMGALGCDVGPGPGCGGSPCRAIVSIYRRG